MTAPSKPQADPQYVKVPQRFSWLAGRRLQWRQYHVIVPVDQYLNAVIKRALTAAQRRSDEELARAAACARAPGAFDGRSCSDSFPAAARALRLRLAFAFLAVGFSR